MDTLRPPYGMFAELINEPLKPSYLLMNSVFRRNRTAVVDLNFITFSIIMLISPVDLTTGRKVDSKPIKHTLISTFSRFQIPIIRRPPPQTSESNHLSNAKRHFSIGGNGFMTTLVSGNGSILSVAVMFGCCSTTLVQTLRLGRVNCYGILTFMIILVLAYSTIISIPVPLIVSNRRISRTSNGQFEYRAQSSGI